MIEHLKKVLLFLHIVFIPFSTYDIVPFIRIDILFLYSYFILFLVQKRKFSYNRNSLYLFSISILFTLFLLLSTAINNQLHVLNDVLFLSSTVFIYLFTDIFLYKKDVFKNYVFSALLIVVLVFLRGFSIFDISSFIGVELKYFNLFRANIFGVEYIRNYGIFANSGPFALYIVIPYTFSLYKYINEKRRIYAWVSILILTIVVLSLSRNAFLSICLATFLLINFSRIRYKYIYNVLLALFGAIVIYLFAQANYLLGDEFLETGSRLSQFQNLPVTFVMENIFWGVGSYMQSNLYVDYELHNVYLLMLVNFGLFVFLSFISYVSILFLSYLNKKVYRENTVLFVILICGLISINFFTGFFIREFWCLLSLASLVVYSKQGGALNE